MLLFRTLTVAAARDRIMTVSQPLPTEEVTLAAAMGRVVAEDIRSGEDVPGFDRATMDGFAVCAADTFGASEGLPAYLRIAGEVMMGQAPDGDLDSGASWQIPTGGMLPAGADAVVMVEHTEAAGPGTVAVLRPVAPGDNVVRCGEDVQAGHVLIPVGRRLQSQDIGLLGACGVVCVPVRRQPVVGLIGTGDEIVGVGAVPGPGQVRDVNTPALAAAVAAAGGKPVVFGVVPDELPLLIDVIERAVAESDLVLVSGGSSVGVRDLTLRALNSLPGTEILFHGLAVRPGKPTVGAVIGGKAVFGLPGHPVSALVVFEFLVRPLLEPEKAVRPPLRVPLSRSVRSAPGREDYVRVRLMVENGALVAVPVLGKSGLIATLSRADGLVRLSLDAEGAEAGEMVDLVWHRG